MTPAELAHEQLTADERDLARQLRQAARVVAHAGLPSEYRCAAFEHVLERRSTVLARA